MFKNNLFKKFLYLTKASGLFSVLAFFLFAALFVQSEGMVRIFLIPSDGMLPTLRPSMRIISENLSPLLIPLNRGDIVTFYPPQYEIHQDPFSKLKRIIALEPDDPDAKVNMPRIYIARVIGLPKDTLQFKAGVGVFINGKKLEEPYVLETLKYCKNSDQSLECAPQILKEDEYFLLQDNRNNSYDSRDYGPVQKNRILGKLAGSFNISE
jgi:signal peptidase I